MSRHFANRIAASLAAAALVLVPSAAAQAAPGDLAAHFLSKHRGRPLSTI